LLELPFVGNEPIVDLQCFFHNMRLRHVNFIRMTSAGTGPKAWWTISVVACLSRHSASWYHTSLSLGWTPSYVPPCNNLRGYRSLCCHRTNFRRLPDNTDGRLGIVPSFLCLCSASMVGLPLLHVSTARIQRPTKPGWHSRLSPPLRRRTQSL